MKQLSSEEFYDRVLAVLRARRIFITPGITKNISEAFEIYQEVIAERDRQVFLDIQYYGNKLGGADRFERPKCPVCDSPMLFRQVPENVEGIKTQLVCSNRDCDTVYDSEKTLEEWMKELRNEDRLQ